MMAHLFGWVAKVATDLNPTLQPIKFIYIQLGLNFYKNLEFVQEY